MPDNNTNSFQQLQIPIETQISDSVLELKNLLTSSNLRTADNRIIIEVYETYLRNLVSRLETENIAFPLKSFQMNLLILY